MFAVSVIGMSMMFMIDAVTSDVVVSGVVTLHRLLSMVLSAMFWYVCYNYIIVIVIHWLYVELIRCVLLKCWFCLNFTL